MERYILTDEHAKVKARDIVSGWPRGRSTVSTYDNDRWRWWGWYSIFPHRNSDEYKEQMRMEVVYHQMQQAMVNEWFALYRARGKNSFSQGIKKYVSRNNYHKLLITPVGEWQEP